MKKRGNKGTRILISEYNNQLVKSKRSQLQISFGMIFSVILIIVFIAVAIYAIIMFLGIKCTADTGLFKQDLQDEVNRAWSGDESSFVFNSTLPSGIEKICFINLLKEEKGENKNIYTSFKKYGYVNVNMFFWPLNKACSDVRAFDIQQVNISNITEENNPYCIDAVDNKINMRIEKDFRESLVRVN